MTALASRAYAHRSRNGFLIALWLAKNAPEAFSSMSEHAQRIVRTMLAAQSEQKLGRRPKAQTIITSSQATLVWRIRDAKLSDQETLLRHVCDFGLDLVADGYISIMPDDELYGWKLILSPEGDILAQRLEA